jgi:hypothetical protein
LRYGLLPTALRNQELYPNLSVSFARRRESVA